MKVLNKSLSDISNHQFLRIDYKYWNITEKVKFDNYVLLKDLFFVINGTVQTSNYSDLVTPFPYVRIGDIDYKYGIKKDRIIYLHEIPKKNLDRVLKSDDLVVATIGATVGKTGLAESVCGGTHSNNTVALRKRDSNLNTKFYEKLFQTDYYKEYFMGIVSHKAQPNLQQYDLENMRIPVVDESEIETKTKTINDFIGTIESYKEQIPETNEILDKVFSTSFGIKTSEYRTIDDNKEYSPVFSKFDQKNCNLRFSYRWNKSLVFQEKLINSVGDCKKLDKYIISTQNGWSPDCDDTKSNLRVLGIDSINKDGVLSFENVKFSDDEKTNLESYIIKNGDFFISRGNTVDLVAMASVAYVKEDDPVTVFPDLLIRVCFSDDINKEYMAFVFNSFIGRAYFKYVTKGKNQTMVKVSPRELADFYVPLPDIQTQQSIVDKIHAGIAKQEEIKSKIADLRNQIDSIIEEAITRGDE